MFPTCPRLLLFTLALLPVTSVAQTPSAAKAATRSCTVDHTEPTSGERALASRNYGAALTFYQAALAADPTSDEAHLGLVRALAGQDKTADALADAASNLTQHPSSALAEVASAEAAYRKADFESMRLHAISALKLNPCEARAVAVEARFFTLIAHFATAARLLAQAHQLRPGDELIRRAWINSLPPSHRLDEISQYLANAKTISDNDRRLLTLEQTHLTASHPGECRIVSNPGSTKIPFIPIFGDNMHPVAYGLEVAFDGKKRRMEIDSGASGITLSPEAAKRLGLTPELHGRIGGIGDEGAVGSFTTHVASIQIGNVQLADCMVEVLQKSRLDIDGLIGPDVFGRWLATLDFPDRELDLKPLPPLPPSPTNDDETLPHDAIVPPHMEDWLHFARIGHNILIPTSVNNGPIHYMIVDTGAADTIFSLRYAKEAGKVGSDEDREFKGLSGKVAQNYTTGMVRMQFGNFAIPPYSYPAFNIDNASHGTGVEVSGFIGLPTLSLLAITIDYRDNLMQLKYDRYHTGLPH
ncbi:MAG: retroviral-like aspartic protease family protein [Acidobacteriota bacterium]